MAFTCGFSRNDCSHTELFRANYQRTNRTKGSKILRCFPHCCPDHVARSFCGAPLYLDVHKQEDNFNPNYSNASAPRLSDDHHLPVLLVFARFRLQQEPGFRVGELLSPDAIARSVQSDENPNGEWIKSALIHRASTSQDLPSWRFEINSSARWFYGWESGVAKSHRLREHVLDVLVTTPESSGMNEPAEWLRVVATAQSPPFKMISFRRATPEALTLLSTSSAPTVPLPSRKPTHHPLIRPPLNLPQLTQPRTHDVPRPLQGHVQSQSVNQLGDLAVVWTFIQRIPLRGILPLTPAMERVFRRQLERRTVRRDLKTIGRNERPQDPAVSVDETLGQLLQQVDSEVPHHPPHPPGPMLKIASHVALWLCWDPVLHGQWHRILDDAAQVLLDGRALRRCFEEVVVPWLWMRVDAFLARVDWTLPALVAAIERDVAMSDEESAAWVYETFVTHVRERFVDHERAATVHRRLSFRPSTPPQPSAFDGEWLATLEDLHVQVSSADVPGRTWRLVHLLWFWREFSGLAITLDPSTFTLCLRSLVCRDEMPTDVMELVLDHKCRWARHVPSGTSTLAVSLAGRNIGDYVGKLSLSGREIHLNCYAWPQDDQDVFASCFQVHFRAPSTSSEPLQVRITENQGRLDPRPLGLDVTHLSREIRSRPLHQRLTLVPRWERCSEWLVEYHRVG